MHPDGEYPDRFILLMPDRSRAGIPFGYCRICGNKWWPGQSGGQAVDPATIALMQEQVRAAEERRAMERQRKLADFSTRELWDELHRRMGEEQREWWRLAGIPDSWQDYLHLGYDADKIYAHGDEVLHSPAYTIPYFRYGWAFCTMQYRLVNPANPEDRYRFESGLGTSYYMTTPSKPIGDQVVICEGAKKAAVVKIYGEENEVTVLGIPSKTDWKSNGTIEAVKDSGRVWIMLDPDCWQAPEGVNEWTPQPIALARAIGKQARIIECPVKADDAFLQYNMSTAEWNALKKQAVVL